MSTTSSSSASTAPPFANRRNSAAISTSSSRRSLRDHRKLGKDLKLFVIRRHRRPGLWSSGRPRARSSARNCRTSSRRSCASRGYQQVFTPHIGRLELYKTSGHFPYYKDAQFPAAHRSGSLGSGSPTKAVPARNSRTASKPCPPGSPRKSMSAPAVRSSAPAGSCRTTSSSRASC